METEKRTSYLYDLQIIKQEYKIENGTKYSNFV